MSELETARCFLLLLLSMVKGKRIREKGKTKFSEYFKRLKESDRVCVVPAKEISRKFPKKLVGLTGTVQGFRGEYTLVKLKDKNKVKTYIIHPVHLRIV